MKYKLATFLEEQLNYLFLDLGYSAITLQQGASISITPQTLNYLGNAINHLKQVDMLLLFQILDY
jgi:hypothetical protein